MNAKELIESSNGKIFSVDFIKKDGTLRKMRARTGVKKYLKGGKQAYNPTEYGLVNVFDMDAKDYRSIRVDNVVRIKVNGREVAY